MFNMKLRLSKIDGCELPPPAMETEGSAGFDLRANGDQVLPPGSVVLIGTGYRWEIPRGVVGMVCPRSGLALKHGVTVLNAPGIIDSDFRGEVCVILVNMSPVPFTILSGDRIAQMALTCLAQECVAEVEIVDELGGTARGEGGFGHTGTA